MIRLVGGLPGSGKSYFAANFISKFGEYDNLYKTFVIKKDIKIFTNLDDLQIQHESLEQCISKYGGAEKFFTIDNFTKVRDIWPKAHILIIIDEAQRMIDDDLLKNKDVAFFFQYHRHLGIDIFLLTNDIASCSKKVVQLCEFVIEAQPRSKGLPGVFRYKFLDTKGTFLYSQSVRLKQEVFSIYKSFTTDETEKPKNVVLHWIVTGLVVLTLSVVSFKLFVNKIMHHKSGVASASTLPVKPVQPVQRAYTTSRVVPLAALPAPVRGKVGACQKVRPKAAPASSVPAVVPVKVAALPLVSPPTLVLPAGYEVSKVTGVITVGDKKFYSLSGRLVPSNECKFYNDKSNSAICTQVASVAE